MQCFVFFEFEKGARRRTARVEVVYGWSPPATTRVNANELVQKCDNLASPGMTLAGMIL